MKARLMMIGSALMASLICLPAMAQQGSAMGGGMMQGGPGAHGPRDCSQAADPAACTAHREARAKAFEACKNTAGAQRRQCHAEQMQNFDCGKSANPQRCEARKQTYRECQGQVGPAFRQCVQQKMPAADCGKAADPSRCEQHQKARAACQNKLGPEHKACLREQFNVK